MARAISIMAGYEPDPEWADTGIHGHVVISVGSHPIIRIPCRHNSEEFLDYPEYACEQVVAGWLGALANTMAAPDALGF